eukprot:1161112-Pelagomonas_calceolata.AAC.19
MAAQPLPAMSETTALACGYQITNERQLLKLQAMVHFGNIVVHQALTLFCEIDPAKEPLDMPEQQQLHGPWHVSKLVLLAAHMHRGSL